MKKDFQAAKKVGVSVSEYPPIAHEVRGGGCGDLLVHTRSYSYGIVKT